jgi:hypothetical protein
VTSAGTPLPAPVPPRHSFPPTSNKEHGNYPLTV